VPNPPAITLRLATEADLPFIASVYASTREQELAQVDWTPEQKAAFCHSQFQAQTQHYSRHYPTGQQFIILSGEMPAGRLYTAHWETEIRIMDIALLPAFRSRGIGTQLLRDLQAEASAAGGKTLSIHVESFNPALRLYQRLGFQIKENKGVYQFMTWVPPTPNS
jgi:ribosomal protein S18 acetylase RimI-like enzyme